MIKAFSWTKITPENTVDPSQTKLPGPMTKLYSALQWKLPDGCQQCCNKVIVVIEDYTGKDVSSISKNDPADSGV
jgi:hypothetical protein